MQDKGKMVAIAILATAGALLCLVLGMLIQAKRSNHTNSDSVVADESEPDDDSNASADSSGSSIDSLNDLLDEIDNTDASADIMDSAGETEQTDEPFDYRKYSKDPNIALLKDPSMPETSLVGFLGQDSFSYNTTVHQSLISSPLHLNEWGFFGVPDNRTQDNWAVLMRITDVHRGAEAQAIIDQLRAERGWADPVQMSINENLEFVVFDFDFYKPADAMVTVESLTMYVRNLDGNPFDNAAYGLDDLGTVHVEGFLPTSMEGQYAQHRIGWFTMEKTQEKCLLEIGDQRLPYEGDYMWVILGDEPVETPPEPEPEPEPAQEESIEPPAEETPVEESPTVEESVPAESTEPAEESSAVPDETPAAEESSTEG